MDVGDAVLHSVNHQSCVGRWHTDVKLAVVCKAMELYLESGGGPCRPLILAAEEEVEKPWTTLQWTGTDCE